MGDMADFTLDCALHELDENSSGEYYVRPLRVLKCKSCKKPHLVWRKFNERWVMMEQDGSPHTCKGYSPPIEVFKTLADEAMAKKREKEMWILRDKAKKRGGLQKMINIITDEQLVDLYTCFVRDDQYTQINPDVGMNWGYGHEISILKTEILKRMI
jgi:hypothetical protein